DIPRSNRKVGSHALVSSFCANAYLEANFRISASISIPHRASNLDFPKRSIDSIPASCKWSSRTKRMILVSSLLPPNALTWCVVAGNRPVTQQTWVVAHLSLGMSTKRPLRGSPRFLVTAFGGFPPSALRHSQCPARVLCIGKRQTPQRCFVPVRVI